MRTMSIALMDGKESVLWGINERDSFEFRELNEHDEDANPFRDGQFSSKFTSQSYGINTIKFTSLESIRTFGLVMLSKGSSIR